MIEATSRSCGGDALLKISVHRGFPVLDIARLPELRVV